MAGRATSGAWRHAARPRFVGALVALAVSAGLAAAPAGAGPAEGARATTPAPAPAEGAPAEAPTPVVFVHGAGGSAARFEVQALRFAGNGYPADRLTAHEYDSTFATNTLADVHAGLDRVVAGLRERTGEAQVDLVAEGLGGFVALTWLNSGQARAAGVAHYVELAGTAGGTVPAGVPALAVRGRGTPGRAAAGATELRLPGVRHDQVVGSPQAFAAAFRFLAGHRPRTTRVVPEAAPEVTLAGRAVVRPYNVGVEGATLAVHRLDGRGRRVDDTPEATVPVGADGAWGPVPTARGARHELVLARPGLPERRVTPPPAVRSDHLVRLAVDEPGEGFGARLVNVLGSSGGYVSIPGAGTVPSPGPQPDPLDCAGPVPDAEPGTPAWYARDANNLFCSQQRHLDQVSHPVMGLPAAAPGLDAYRDPARHDGVRFRYDATTIAGLPAEVYRPCTPGTCPDLPEGLAAVAPPYPAVITLHGGGSNKELHRWSSQALAEAGYLVVAFDGATSANATRVLDWLSARSDPLAADFDGRHVGIAGHSIGGDAAADLAHRDARIAAAVYWDRAGLASPPAEALRVPSLALMSDYGCLRPLVCPLEARRALPDPADRGAKTQDFPRLRDAGIDTMQVALRAATHFDFVPDQLSGNRYAELVSVYYTLAWFDRYVRGADEPAVAADAHARLTARAFDESADRHSISQGAYDPAAAAAPGDPYGGNVPYRIAGMPVANRLSFYYPSRCFLTVPGARSADVAPAGRAASDDVRREGCRPAAP